MTFISDYDALITWDPDSGIKLLRTFRGPDGEYGWELRAGEEIVASFGGQLETLVPPGGSERNLVQWKIIGLQPKRGVLSFDDAKQLVGDAMRSYKTLHSAGGEAGVIVIFQ
ncbi:hypothetical protein ACFOKI_09405 [Sphingomonas qilianensis]|uniref:Uncharacterized protein n=1 Tax=Sphingomonas qilianensis TaxID=1736690 RepID=A0ABU9XQG6_9SPHN